MMRLISTLHQSGIDDNTLVIFTSDHGDMLYSQGLEKKQKPWDESCRVPLLMRLPLKHGTGAKELPATIGTEDIMPTILRICGLKPPHSVQGLDFSKYVSGGKDPSDGAALILCPAPFGQWSRNRGGREYRAIRTQRYTYARDLNGPWLLFDNHVDPYQLNNLIGKSDFKKLQVEMERRLSKKLTKTADTFLPSQELIKKRGYVVDGTGTVVPGP